MGVIVLFGSGNPWPISLAMCVVVTSIFKVGAVQKVLLFGGNGFIGSETATYLLDKGSYDITLVNRGNWYYDSETRVKPRVRSLRCDRFKDCSMNDPGRCEALEKCDEVMEFVRSVDKFDFVVDFSAYNPKILKNSLRVLDEKVGLYIYISTDSVYEVSQEAEHDRLSLEGDAVRPDDVDESAALSEQDPYGSEKLACEELLAASGSVRYVSLRLPDVFGPRDTTYRSWLHFLRIRYYDVIDEPVQVPEDGATSETSLVYVKDVPVAVEAVMLSPGSKVHNQAYNIASKDTFQPIRFLEEWGKMILEKDIVVTEAAGDVPSLGFPSVTRGPISIQKAERELKFKPTPLAKAMTETAEFYETALADFEKERNEVLDVFLDFFPESKHDDIMDEVEKHLATRALHGQSIVRVVADTRWQPANGLSHSVDTERNGKRVRQSQYVCREEPSSGWPSLRLRDLHRMNAVLCGGGGDGGCRQSLLLSAFGRLMAPLAVVMLVTTSVAVESGVVPGSKHLLLQPTPVILLLSLVVMGTWSTCVLEGDGVVCDDMCGDDVIMALDYGRCVIFNGKDLFLDCVRLRRLKVRLLLTGGAAATTGDVLWALRGVRQRCHSLGILSGQRQEFNSTNHKFNDDISVEGVSGDDNHYRGCDSSFRSCQG
ncbi:unnamed protein product [Notodromas monacha]|uniref:NAD-dependent epimerase/dehydratase domain-containing protein n=1 Tax=Notodromas monacha TaxID=399045 RepID=A0A7R9BXV1_9CRUS|nr:unnamed protein product [Notodromas monacha]CAG0922825.1 unnamed protein product [Notodromas monacha]